MGYLTGTPIMQLFVQPTAFVPDGGNLFNAKITIRDLITQCVIDVHGLNVKCKNAE